MQERYNWLAIPAGVGIGTLGNLTSAGNTALVKQVEALYAQYQRGHITKGQYDGRRRKALQQFTAKVGPFEKVLMGGRTTPEAIRINRLKGIPATHNIRRNVARLSRMSSLATKGGVLLSGAGLYVSCRNIAGASDRHEKNEIFVETMASTAMGAATSAVIFFALVSNPVGWGVALGLAAGSAAAAFAAGVGAKIVYNNREEKLDLVAASGIERLCS